MRLKNFIVRESLDLNISTEATADTGGVDMMKDESTYENVQDIAGSMVDEKDSGQTLLLPTGQSNLLKMGNFLERPVRISQFEVAIDDDLTYEVDIWQVYTSHPSVRAKLRNYAFMTGTLNVRITVSGTTWHFGKIQASYQPLAGFNENLTYLGPQLGGINRFAALQYLSQSVGASVIDINDNKPLEMAFPYISPQPMIRLFNKSPLILAAAGPYQDTVGFGKLYLNSISPIRAVGETATPIGVQIYAWMTDVELGAPTGTVIEIGTEAKDEREAGPIETIASNANKLAGSLAKVPIIGPYAQAAQKPLAGAAWLASLLGFSYPTMINEPHRMKNEPFQNGAQLIGYDTNQRITLDPKQELSVDPRATGTGIDELSYDYLCSRESLIDTFEWTTEDGQMASSIWMAPVNPNVSKRIVQAVPGNYIVTPTPLAMVAMPHEYWRGDITFRFEIVCSHFHRGTLAVIYEPNISQNVVIDTSLDLNKQYIQKIDLQTVQDFEVTVKWAHARPWARVLTHDLFGDLGTVGFLGDQLFDFANGYIAVTPYTALQSPDDSPITINVYIRSENMHFNLLTASSIPTGRPVTEATAHEVDHYDLNESTASEQNLCIETFGEKPISFRSVMRRFATHFNLTGLDIVSSDPAAALTFTERIYPLPNPTYGDSSTIVPNNIYGYLRYAYLGMRGGFKYRFGLTGPVVTNSIHQTKVHLNAPDDNEMESFGYANTSSLYSSTIGTVAFVPATNGGIEFELPLYTNNLFGISFSDNPFPLTSIVDTHLTRNFTVVTAVSPITTSGETPIGIVLDGATAEDFTFMRFSGCPVYAYSE